MPSTAETIVRVAEEAWPELALDRRAFVAACTKRVRETGGEPHDAIATLHVADLYLAFGCATGNVAALHAFDATILARVDAYLGHLDASPAFADEVRQAVRAKLLVADAGSPPKIAEYSGRGPLGAWVRSIAARTALNLRRTTKREAPAIEEHARSSGSDPEIEYARAAYARDFRVVFQRIIATRSEDERALLRMHYLDAMNIDAIGEALGLHRATVARRLNATRSEILTETRRLLGDKLRIDDVEVRELIATAREEVDVSLARILASSVTGS